MIQVSDLFQDQLCKNVLAKVTPGTNNKVSEEINVILNVPFKQECNITLIYLYTFKGTYNNHYFRSCKNLEISSSPPKMGRNISNTRNKENQLSPQ